MSYSPLERIEIKNGLNRIVTSFLEKIGHELVESVLSIKDREIPNVGMCLRRLGRISTLLVEMKREQQKWNEEV